MLYAVIRQEGAAWDRSRSLREQDGWREHAEYMDRFHEAGFFVFAGPLGDGSPVHRVLLIIEADDQAAIEARFEADPWTQTHMLETVSVERWNVLLGVVRAPNAG
jgi:uncharacterized protein YciI